MYKLLKTSIGGLFGRLIKNIDDNTSVQIMVDNCLTDVIADNTGLKQGCILSPTLFKIFINDMPNVFSENCKPATLHNKNLSCLMFADDVVLVSETKEGLKNCLHKINKYSNSWKLKINKKNQSYDPQKIWEINQKLLYSRGHCIRICGSL